MDITVKINDKFSKTIERLKKQIDSIDDLIEVLLKLDDTDLDKALAKQEMLDDSVTTQTHIVKYRKQGDIEGPPLTPKQQMSEWAQTDTLRRQIGRETKNYNFGADRLPDGSVNARPKRKNVLGNIKKGSINPSRVGKLQKALKSKKFKKLNKIMGDLDGKVKRLIPSMVAWFNLLAAFLPMLITWGTALLGIASAMGAVIAAGAGIGLMGFLGMDDPMGRLEEFAGNLKDIFQPVMNAFQPIVEKMLEATKMDLSLFAQSMQDIAVFSEIVQDTVSGIIGWFRRLMEISVSLEHIISQLADRFGSFIGGGLLDFFEWLVEEAYRNQEAFINLTRILGKVIAAIYNLSKVASTILIEFEPVVDLIVWISELLNNDFIMGLIASAAKVYVLAKAFVVLKTAIQAVTAALAKNPAGLLALGGALVIAQGAGLTNGGELSNVSNNGFGNGGPGGASGVGMDTSSRGGDTYYTMNVDGNTTDRHVQKFKDIEAGHRAVESKDDKRSRGN